LLPSFIRRRATDKFDKVDKMIRTRHGLCTITAIILLSATAARAADLPPPAIVQQPVPEVAGDWYLRGNIGVGLNGNPTLDYLPNQANLGNGFAFQHNSIGDTFFIGGGVGYEWNNWLRFDATAEYRAKSRVYAFGNYPPNGLDTYEGNLNSWVFLGNAYIDLGTWNCFTPFIGAGIGGAYNTLANFTDINPPNGAFGFGRDPSEWHLAWALHAGVAYNVTQNFKIELAYRYLNYGSITDTIDCHGGCNPDSFKFGKLYSNDIMLGMRWTCCDVAPPPPPPYLRSKG
jgi:opacity protein-like surface antigen